MKARAIMEFWLFSSLTFCFSFWWK
jgi:hypothetical protein